MENKLRSIKEMTQEELFHITDLATGNNFNAPWASKQREVETGGYGLRRLVEWEMDGEKHDFTISSPERGHPWTIFCSSEYSPGDMRGVIIQNVSKIVDYCVCNNLDIRNNP